jgi:hypothetical protein
MALAFVVGNVYIDVGNVDIERGLGKGGSRGLGAAVAHEGSYVAEFCEVP